MPALTMILTNGGFAKVSAAQLGQAVDLNVAQVGFTDQVFVPAPTLTALPGEFRRIGDIAGSQVGDNIVHLVVRDEAEVAYGARGIGLFLADGTLFAVHGSPDRIVEKTVLTTLLLAQDIAFLQPGVDQLTFGSTAFIDPPATTERRGVIELATQAEVNAGADTVRAVTPATLKGKLQGTAISGAGLATGAGDLATGATITVPAASDAEGVAGASIVKAMTPKATKAAIDAAIAAVINGAPGALDQLNELAAAMGNDPNFATTMINALATKALAIRTITGSGLVSGGGDLSANRILNVIAAVAADVVAGTAVDRAVTPAALAGAGVVRIVAESLVENGGYRAWSDGFKEAWGLASVPANGSAIVTLPVAHTAFVVALCSGTFEDIGADENVGVVESVGSPPTGFRIFNAYNSGITVRWSSRGV